MTLKRVLSTHLLEDEEQDGNTTRGREAGKAQHGLLWVKNRPSDTEAPGQD